MPPVDRRSVVQGAALALAVMIPTILVTKAIDATVGIREDSNALFLPYLLVLAGLVAGGRHAARHHPDAALAHGALGAGAAYLVIGVASAVISVARGNAPNAAALVFNGVMAMSAGILGGMLSLRRRRRGSPRPQPEGRGSPL